MGVLRVILLGGCPRFQGSEHLHKKGLGKKDRALSKETNNTSSNGESRGEKNLGTAIT